MVFYKHTWFFLKKEHANYNKIKEPKKEKPFSVSRKAFKSANDFYASLKR
jgi:hypothetical protein